ncbi:hypothetical protein MG293_004048 [Ovis ammon polii]|uniref:Uncharacterized protein n=1 Tax=Ovis ammon polii TaxID=230172 RepID=A0AAD4UJL8_OVIAM|nr:hypothetical protein MG293_004048 [Ovis ammon polii]KAI4577634.1 hypothetical protein MJT46_003469 [Ovis ammon polii x Ovis aries]
MNPPAKQETWVQSLGQEDPLVEQPTAVFLPGKFHGQRSLAGYSPWGLKELDMTGELSIPSLRQASYRVCMHTYLFHFLNSPIRKSENKAVLCPILQMRKLRSSEVKLLAQSNKAKELEEPEFEASEDGSRAPTMNSNRSIKCSLNT